MMRDSIVNAYTMFNDANDRNLNEFHGDVCSMRMQSNEIIYATFPIRRQSVRSCGKFNFSAYYGDKI